MQLEGTLGVIMLLQVADKIESLNNIKKTSRVIIVNPTKEDKIIKTADDIAGV